MVVRRAETIANSDHSSRVRRDTVDRLSRYEGDRSNQLTNAGKDSATRVDEKDTAHDRDGQAIFERQQKITRELKGR